MSSTITIFGHLSRHPERRALRPLPPPEVPVRRRPTVTLTGYLGRDPQIRLTRCRTYSVERWNPVSECRETVERTTRPREYAVLSLATHETANGQTRTRWHRLVVWNVDRTQRRNVRIARKGWQVEVTGYPETFSLTNDDGKTVELDQVVVEDFRIRRVQAPQLP